jgi:hypothetical protein
MKIVAYILTKTGGLRWLANLIATTLAGWGIAQENETAIIASAVLAILNGLLTKATESIKDANVKELQREVGGGVKVDGWAGPVTRKEIIYQTRAAATVRHEMQTGQRRGGFFKG